MKLEKKTDNYGNIQGQYMGVMKFRPKGWKIFQKNISKRI